MTRAPNRSVSAPTGTRPIEPTITGTATSSDCAAKLRPSRSLMPGPSGPSSAHAQKLTMNPMVATVRFATAPAARVRPAAPDLVTVVICPPPQQLRRVRRLLDATDPASVRATAGGNLRGGPKVPILLGPPARPAHRPRVGALRAARGGVSQPGRAGRRPGRARI